MGSLSKSYKSNWGGAKNLYSSIGKSPGTNFWNTKTNFLGKKFSLGLSKSYKSNWGGAKNLYSSTRPWKPTANTRPQKPTANTRPQKPTANTHSSVEKRRHQYEAIKNGVQKTAEGYETVNVVREALPERKKFKWKRF